MSEPGSTSRLSILGHRSSLLSQPIVMAPRRASASAAPADPEPNTLPTFNGSQLDLLKWLRDLSNSQHLFEADLAYFIVTGCSVTSSGKTAVVSPEHSVLLNNDIIRQQEFSIMKPTGSSHSMPWLGKTLLLVLAPLSAQHRQRSFQLFRLHNYQTTISFLPTASSSWTSSCAMFSCL